MLHIAREPVETVAAAPRFIPCRWGAVAGCTDATAGRHDGLTVADQRRPPNQNWSVFVPAEPNPVALVIFERQAKLWT
jgi:hypothetical protein